MLDPAPAAGQDDGARGPACGPGRARIGAGIIPRVDPRPSTARQGWGHDRSSTPARLTRPGGGRPRRDRGSRPRPLVRRRPCGAGRLPHRARRLRDGPRRPERLGQDHAPAHLGHPAAPGRRRRVRGRGGRGARARRGPAAARLDARHPGRVGGADLPRHPRQPGPALRHGEGGGVGARGRAARVGRAHGVRPPARPRALPRPAAAPVPGSGHRASALRPAPGRTRQRPRPGRPHPAAGRPARHGRSRHRRARLLPRARRARGDVRPRRVPP